MTMRVNCASAASRPTASRTKANFCSRAPSVEASPGCRWTISEVYALFCDAQYLDSSSFASRQSSWTYRSSRRLVVTRTVSPT